MLVEAVERGLQKAGDSTTFTLVQAWVKVEAP